MDSSRNGRDGRSHTGGERARNGTEPAQRARQRALCIAALAQEGDVAELGELLRTAGVAVVHGHHERIGVRRDAQKVARHCWHVGPIASGLVDAHDAAQAGERRCGRRPRGVAVGQAEGAPAAVEVVQVDDGEAALVRAGDQQPAVVGAEIDGGVGVAMWFAPLLRPLIRRPALRAILLLQHRRTGGSLRHLYARSFLHRLVEAADLKRV